jgi:hypothetical protein
MIDKDYYIDLPKRVRIVHEDFFKKSFEFLLDDMNIGAWNII